MIEGQWHEKGSATQKNATFFLSKLGYSLTLEDGSIYVGDSAKLKVSERLGNVLRKIILEDDSLFVSADNDAIDILFKDRQKPYGVLHRLETHLRWITMAVLLTLFTGFAFFKWGIPWASERLAHALPYKTNQLISINSMEFLDKYMFDDSTLAQTRQDTIRKHFKERIAILSQNEDIDIEYRIHFRAWNMGKKAIPNALALPSGDIVVTDKFITLSTNQDEIDSVLLHEMGHVVHRHGLEILIEGTFITVAVMLIAGDTSGMGDLGVGLGSALVSSAYSRGHESQADMYAFTHMLRAGIDPDSFGNIMNRMTEYMGKIEVNNNIMDYFSSHPSTKARVELAKQFSQCFKEGLKVCDIKVQE